MAIDIKVPSVGESVTEGNISRWLKKDGARVRQDEPLFELETDKATQEVPAPSNGVLRITVPEGQTVPIGAIIGSIEPSTSAAKEGQAVAAKTEAPRVASEPAPVKNPPQKEPAKTKVESAEPDQETEPKRSENHSQEPTKSTSLATNQATVVAPSDSTGRETRQRMSAIRQRIAEKLLTAQKSTASLTTFNEADMSAITELRTRYKDRFKEMQGVGLGFMSFFVKASVAALKAYPLVNARIEENDVVFQNYFNIGVAVSTDKGLMVPVLRDADRMSFARIEKSIAEVAIKARDGKVSLSDLQGGTFTITNGGIFGSMMSTPILNPPQCAILGMHAITKRPVVRDDQIVIRPMMYLALTYDHRLIDGREAVLFLVKIKECIENPERLLLEV